MKLFSWPDRERIMIFLTWGMVAIMGFPLVYGTTNYVASLNPNRYNMWFEWETQIPFIKEFIWAYLSLNIVIFLPLFMSDAYRLKRYCQSNIATLLLGALIFLIFPGDLGFERIIPNDTLHGPIYAGIHSIDKPHNLVPSLHVTFSLIALFVVVDSHREKKWMVWSFAIWALFIALSVVFTRQHHIADIIGGTLLAFVGIRFIYFRGRNPFKIQRSPTRR